MSKDILLDKEGSIAIVTLNRPDALNAFSMEMREGLATIFENFSKDESVRAVVITGAGRAFSAGGDIKSWGDVKDENRVNTLLGVAHRAAKAVTSLEKPVIAMVNGDALRAGCSLALACDLIIASENARFGAEFVRLGLAPDWGGVYSVSRRLGMAKAKELLLTGKIISAKEALEMGLINSVVAPERLKEIVMELAEKLSQSATKAIGMTKTFLHKVWQMDFNATLEYEAVVAKELVKTMDHQEAVKAFLNKSKPVFIGK